MPGLEAWVSQMRRREFVKGIAVSAAWPLAAHGQQRRRVGVLIGLEEDDPQTKGYLAAFREALGVLGWIEGQGIQIEHRAAPDLDGLRSGAAELLRQAPDLMVTFPTPATNVVRQASADMRIVFVGISDPIGPGFVKSLDHPGGNITGFSNFEETMGGKWLELLREIAPPVNRASMLFNPETANAGAKGGLYGWERASQYATVILVEGLFDYASLWQAGFPNVTCGLGTQLNAHQFRQLCRGPRTVYLAFDADTNGSGQQAAKRLAIQLRREGLNPLIVTLPEGHDPNSFFTSGGNPVQFHAWMEAAQ